MAEPTVSWAALSRKKAALLIGPLRARARSLGYAIGVHGTLSRDIDLIACPWTAAAVSADELAEQLRLVAEQVSGFAENLDNRGASNPAYFDRGCPGAKPHGRRVYTFHLGEFPGGAGGPYIDLSVMPRAPHEDPLNPRD